MKIVLIITLFTLSIFANQLDSINKTSKPLIIGKSLYNNNIFPNVIELLTRQLKGEIEIDSLILDVIINNEIEFTHFSSLCDYLLTRPSLS